MKMTCKKTLYLLWELSCELDKDEAELPFWVKDLYADFEDHEISRSSRAKAMLQFLKGKGDDYEFLQLDLTDSQRPPSHVLHIKQAVIDYLYNHFPEPFIEIEIENKTDARSKRILVDERFQLGAHQRSHEWARKTISEDENAGSDDTWLVYKGYKNRQFSTLNGFEGTFAISLIVKWEEPIIKTCYVINKLFNDHSSKDVTLVAGNGAELKCHKNILAVHSKAFSAMLSAKTGMLEATSGRIQMSDNTKDGIRNLLRYMYGMKLTMVDIPKDVIVELFQTAHKYGIVDLENFLQKYFLSQPVSWFSPDILLELYLFVRHLDVLGKLQEHLLFLMASGDMEELRRCQVFSRLDPTLSLDLSFMLVDYFQKNVKRVPKPKNDDDDGHDDDDEESDEDGDRNRKGKSKRKREN